MTQPILVVEDLKLQIPVSAGALHAIRGVDLSLAPGETLGIVGESGSGKSLTVLSIIGLHPAGSLRTAKSIKLDGIDLLNASDRQLSKQVRGTRAAMIFQEPMTSMNPVLTIGQQMTEALVVHGNASVEEARALAISLLERVGIAGATARLSQYPHQFSGGQRQRIMIAMALMSRPQLLIADEPTTALDVTVQAEILSLLKELQKEMGMAMILVSHNLSIMERTADRIAVMYAGRIAQTGTSKELFEKPYHPYTRALLAALPERAGKGQRLQAIPGIVPSLIGAMPGCAFAARCPHAMDICRTDPPPPARSLDGQVSYCWLEDRPQQVSSATEDSEASAVTGAEILSVHGARRSFAVKRGFFSAPTPLHAVRNVDLTVHEGEFFALVGESGCGKSTLARLLLALDKSDAGQVILNGRDMAKISPLERARLIQPVFQDPNASLNPRRTVFEIVRRPLEVHGIGTKEERDRDVTELLETVGLSPRVHHVRPASLSGGQRQRVAIARALVLKPKMLLCDEPTSALDVSIQAQIINLLADLRRERQLSILLITHDLGVVKHMADRVAVMYLGQIVETGSPETMFEQAAHPYTRALISSAFPASLNKTTLLPGFPNPLDIPSGCALQPRCPFAVDQCRSVVPELRNFGDGKVRCHLAESLNLNLSEQPRVSGWN